MHRIIPVICILLSGCFATQKDANRLRTEATRLRKEAKKAQVEAKATKFYIHSMLFMRYGTGYHAKVGYQYLEAKQYKTALKHFNLALEKLDAKKKPDYWDKRMRITAQYYRACASSILNRKEEALEDLDFLDFMGHLRYYAYKSNAFWKSPYFKNVSKTETFKKLAKKYKAILKKRKKRCKP